MGDEYSRSSAREPSKALVQLVLAPRIESCSWFVQNENLGTPEECPSHPPLLPLPSRQIGASKLLAQWSSEPGVQGVKQVDESHLL